MRLIEFLQPSPVLTLHRRDTPLHYLGGSYREYQNYRSSRLFESMVVNEAAIDRYKTMIPIFKTIDAMLAESGLEPVNTYNTMLESLEWAMRVLKRDDRIVWFIRLRKLNMLIDLGNMFLKLAVTNDVYQPIYDAVNKEYNKALGKINRIYIGSSDSDIAAYGMIVSGTRFRTDITHSLSMNLDAINSTVWGNQSPADLLSHFNAIEWSWAADRESVIDTSTDSQEHQLEIIIQFPDGSAWFNLNRSSCEMEGDAMGHCGNTASNGATETVLSYREPVDAGGRKVVVKNGNYTGTTWRPRLTFIYDNATGMLGEMKGRANEKPKAELHPKIIALLKLDMIKGIVGGGHDPANNFSLDDLPEEVKANLVAAYSKFKTMGDLYAETGFTEVVEGKLSAALETAGVAFVGFETDNNQHYMVIDSYHNPWDFIVTYTDDGDETRGVADTVLNGDSYYDQYDTATTENVIDLIETMVYKQPQSETALRYYMMSTYSDDFGFEHRDGKWVEVGDDPNYDIDEVSDWISVLSENDDELYSQMRWAIDDGRRTGTEVAMNDAFMYWLKTPFDGEGVSLNPTTDQLYDGPVDVRMEIPVLMQYASSVPDWNSFLEDIEYNGWNEYMDFQPMDTPYDGWDEYDADAAITSLDDHIDDIAVPDDIEIPSGGGATESDLEKFATVLTSSLDGARVVNRIDDRPTAIRTPLMVVRRMGVTNGVISISVSVPDWESVDTISSSFQALITAANTIKQSVVIMYFGTTPIKRALKAVGFEPTDNNYLRYDPMGI